MIRHPTKKGMRQPQAVTVSAGITSLKRKPRIAATKIATCWLDDWNEV
jgi:hypothetical protein